MTPTRLRHIALSLSLLLLSGAAMAQLYPEPRRVQGPLSSDRGEDPNETEIILENTTTTRVTLPETRFVPCQARVELAYYQRNTQAHVETTITHPACPSVSGSVDIVATVRDEAGESATLAFAEDWDLQGTDTLTFTRDYPIGENVELRRVRSRQVRCQCLDPAAD